MKQEKIFTRKGVSLIEMIVAIGILSLVMSGVVAYFIHIWPLQKFAMDSARAQLSGSQGVTSIVALIRNMRQSDSGEYALHGINNDEIIFFADQDNDGAVERVRIFLDGSVLRMGIVNPVGNPRSYPIDQEVVQDIIINVQNGSGSYPSEVFRYYDGTNTELTGVFSLGDVRMVEISLYVDIDPSSSPQATHFESFASIRNLSEYDRLQ